MNKQILSIGLGVCGIAAVAGLSVYFALSGGGEIDINDRIRTTDQSGFEHAVLPNTQSELPNGGLRPSGVAPTPVPEPVPEPTVTASTTEASSTTPAPAADASSTPTAETTQ